MPSMEREYRWMATLRPVRKLKDEELKDERAKRAEDDEEEDPKDEAPADEGNVNVDPDDAPADGEGTGDGDHEEAPADGDEDPGEAPADGDDPDADPDEEEERYLVEGYASTFDPYVLFTDEDGTEYSERIDPTAFDEADMSDVVFLYNHEGQVMARNRTGTLQLETDDHGLKVRADLSKSTRAREMYEEIRNGLVDQMSFAFTVAEDDYDKKTHTRTIHRMRKLYDVSAVSMPANPGTDIKAQRAAWLDGAIELERAERLEAQKREEEDKQTETCEEAEATEAREDLQDGEATKAEPCEERAEETEAEAVEAVEARDTQEAETREEAAAEAVEERAETEALEQAEERAREEARAAEAARTETRNRVAAGAGETIKKFIPEVKKMSYEVNSPEYREAFLKHLTGAALPEEMRTATAYTGTTGDTGAGAHGMGLLVPTQMLNNIWSLIDEQHAILGDITMYRTNTYLTVPIHTAISQGDAGTVNENAAADDEINEWNTVTLHGKDFSKTVKISYAMATMSIDALESYLTNEIATRLGAALAKDVVAQVLTDYDATNNAVSISSPVAFADVAGTLAKLKNANGECVIYATNATIYGQLVGMVDSTGRPVFQHDANEGAQGHLIGFPVKTEDAVSDNVLLIGYPKNVVGNTVQDIMIETDRDISKHVYIYSGYARFESKLIAPKSFATLTVSP